MLHRWDVTFKWISLHTVICCKAKEHLGHFAILVNREDLGYRNRGSLQFNLYVCG
jgi:hypothetical protein